MKNEIEKYYELSEKIDRIIEMIKPLEITNLALESKGLSDYTVEKLKEVGKDKVPCNEMFSMEELSTISKSNTSRMDMVFNALCVGFANGVKYSAK